MRCSRSQSHRRRLQAEVDPPFRKQLDTDLPISCLVEANLPEVQRYRIYNEPSIQSVWISANKESLSSASCGRLHTKPNLSHLRRG